MLIFFKISLFLLHQFVLHSSFEKLNAGSILKVKVASPKSDAIFVATNKRINTNSNETSWLANGKSCGCYYTCDFDEMDYFTE